MRFQGRRAIFIFVSRQATVDGLSQQIGERQLSVLAVPAVHDVFGDECTPSQTLIPLAHQKKTTAGSDARAWEVNFQRRIKRKLKELILFLTPWVEAATEFILASKPHEDRCRLGHTAIYTSFKQEVWV